ncbi:LUD domain-containing protein [Ornithinimicrobium sp. W1679]|uniref:LUD domain-containing protein n=1 Tax=Ornithinimicrobium sp. W1679 TaxID=3418770 RepID=UPI003CE7F429
MTTHQEHRPEARSRELRFAEALESRGGRALHARDTSHAAVLLAELVSGRTVCADDDAVVQAVIGDARVVEDAWSADLGVTTALCAAVETSTLAHPFDRSHPRSTGLVPPVHVVVLPVDRLRETYTEVLQELLAVRPAPSGLRLETGPSSSGDIEQIHVRGMHGPVELVVVLVGSSAAEVDKEQTATALRAAPAEPTAQAAPPESGGPHADPAEEEDVTPTSAGS